MSDLTATNTGVPDGGVRRAGRWLLGRWPSVLGVLVAAVAVFGARGTDLAPLVLLLGLNYLVAEISRKRWMAWVGTLAIFVLYPLSQRLDPGLLRTILLWTAVAGVLVGGLIATTRLGAIERPRIIGGQGSSARAEEPAVTRSGDELAIQTVAMLAFGAVAVIALFIDPTVGAYLVAAGLIGHGIWDAIHHRRNLVVSRRFAEFCAVLDIVAGAAVVWITLTSSAG